jgi:tetratricopeptide (TPR) repeat protein
MMRNYLQRTILILSSLFIFTALTAYGQAGSTRPRRVTRQTATRTNKSSTSTDKSSDDLLDVEPANANNSNSARRNNRQPASDSNAPLLDTTASTPVGAPVSGDNNTNTTARVSNNNTASNTSHAFTLLQAKQYAAALSEARQVALSDPNNSDAWKIAGFAEINLKQYEAAATDLQKALDLQRAAKQEDPYTVDALGHAYFLSEKYDRALPFLIISTTRKDAKPDPTTLYYRGVSEYQLKKSADAERTFTAIVKDNPKDTASLFYLGEIAFERNDMDAAINNLNRATLSDARSVSAWNLLTLAYLQRAAAATAPEKADADYLNAVRAGEGLTRVRTDAQANTLFAQALIGAKQFARAATVLERFVTAQDASPSALYLYGIAQSRAKNFPKAINALERAATKTPDDANLYRELGYAYEVSKQYAKALAAYEKGLQLAPNDADFKESAERVRPYAK